MFGTEISSVNFFKPSGSSKKQKQKKQKKKQRYQKLALKGFTESVNLLFITIS